MNSLREDHLTEISSDSRTIIEGQVCWEFFSCSKVLCPAHGKRIEACWLLPRTHCYNYIEEDFFQKLPTCLACNYFEARGNAHPKGWNHFFAEQLHNYNITALELIYQKEESFVEILNRIPDGLFTTDQEWRITYFNPGAEKITGFSAYDAVGMFCKDVFKNPICETDCALKRAVKDGSNVHNREYEITNIDGKTVPIICSTSAFRDHAGRITGGIEIFKDITEFKGLQEEVARREKKYRRIFEGSHDMIYTSNLDGKMLDVNQAGVEMLGFQSKQEMLGISSARQLYRNAQDRDKFLSIINQKGYVKDFEVDFRRKDGVPIHVLISSRRYESPISGNIEFEGIIKDITRRKRTEEDLKQRNLELSILNSVAVALNHATDLHHILKATLSNVLKVLNLKSGAIFLIDREKKSVRLQVKQGIEMKAFKKSDEIMFKDALLMKYLIEEETQLTPRPTFPPFHVSFRTKEDQDALRLSCFLITFKGKGVGFFGLDLSSPRILSPHEIHLLGSLGNFLGEAIENTKLMETIRLHRQELTRLTDKLFQSQEKERRRIARELHDEAGQSLTAVKFALERLEEQYASKNTDLSEEISEVKMMISRTSSEIRRMAYRLHPTLLSDLGLEPALNLYFKEVATHSGLDIDFHMVGFDRRLDVDTETVFYRFSQEAMTNTLKHSNAEHFRLSIIKSYPKIIFFAEDDGVGFDGQIPGNNKRSLGLIGMRERASLLGGKFQLRSTPGEGTRIRIEIPLPEDERHG